MKAKRPRQSIKCAFNDNKVQTKKKPRGILVNLAADLHNCRVCESLIENVHVTAQLQCVNNEVFCSGGNLHQACQAQEAPVGMMLKNTKRAITSTTEVILQKKYSTPNEGRNINRGILKAKDNQMNKFSLCRL